jgi:murein DD-endopeptidase MepM/ murein hydrolase activator NlpD
MGWPLAGAGQIVSGFGADRDGGKRHHQGNDIAAPRLMPVLAVADGVVLTLKQEVGTEECCYVALRHEDGWQSYYVHLNNDTWGTDDGQGIGVRPDLVEGTEVAAGEVIGWVGDSGNAEETVVHLHFELRNPEGVAVDPQASLVAAEKAALLPDPEPNWPYADDDGLDTEWLAAEKLT